MKRIIALVLVVFFVVGISACQKKVGVSPLPKAEVTVYKPGAANAPAAFAAPDFMVEKIYFEFDKATLDKKAQDVLNKKAAWLKSNSSIKVLIEGNCDERGTAEYNLALGERRAESAKKYLVDAGISADRIKTISYGEEKPVCKEANEGCWAKNRNDNFILIK
jgi:peptidoglycan-associated lipoprotein